MGVPPPLVHSILNAQKKTKKQNKTEIESNCAGLIDQS